jgi:hypothetical protein
VAPRWGQLRTGDNTRKITPTHPVGVCPLIRPIDPESVSRLAIANTQLALLFYIRSLVVNWEAIPQG